MTNGFENTFETFIAMLGSGNIGKAFGQHSDALP